MKKLSVTLFAALFSAGVFANTSCLNKPHAKIPSKNLSLYDKKSDQLKDYKVVRDKLIKDGWKPVDSGNEYADYPEENCMADKCIYTYQDKYQNKLFIEKPDDISSIEAICH